MWHRLSCLVACFAMVAWLGGGLAERVHDLRVTTAGHTTSEASADTHSPSVHAVHACAMDLAQFAGEPPTWVAPAPRRSPYLRLLAARLPAAPRGPPALTNAPKTSPPTV